MKEGLHMKFRPEMLLWISGFFLVLLYQNCGSGTSTSSGDSSGTFSANAVEDFSVSDTQNIEISSSVASVIVSDEEFGTSLNVDTGVISSGGNNFCLTTAEHNQLKDILSRAQLCVPEKVAGQICSLVYTPPYAKLVNSEEESAEVGEKTSSCEVTQDFCSEDDSNELKNLLQSIIDSLDGSRSC